MNESPLAAPRSTDNRWSALLLAILAAVGIAICVFVAYLFPKPPDWGVQHSEPFELRAGVEGSWAPQYEPESTRDRWRRLCVVGDGNMYVFVADGDFTERLRDENVRVLVRVTPRDAVRHEVLRDHGVDGWIPAESSWELQVEPPRVERVDWRIEARPDAAGPDSGRRARMQIYGIQDSVIDLQTPATIVAVALALFVLVPSLVWFRREVLAVRAGR